MHCCTPAFELALQAKAARGNRVGQAKRPKRHVAEMSNSSGEGTGAVVRTKAASKET